MALLPRGLADDAPPFPGRAAVDRGESADATLRRLTDGRHGFSRFFVAGEIDRGGMGIVLRVHDPDLRRELALKRLRPIDPIAHDDDPFDATRRIARFLEEAQVTAQLDHPGVVPVHEVGVDPDGQPYFTMKLVRGLTLKEVLKLAASETDGWNLTRVLHVLQRVCEAMSYAHAHGIVHRDLKPSNVMVGRFGEVYVMDWGLARVMPPESGADADSTAVFSARRSPSGPSPELATEEGQVLGTPPYMSPEQASGHPDEVGPPTDVYALGAILYHALAGHAPYGDGRGAGDNCAILRRLQTEPPTPVDRLARRAPAEIVAICRKAMERDLASRYRSMKELSEDLRAYLELRVVRAYRTGPLVELRKWVTRNRVSAGLAALVVALVTAGAVGYGLFQAARARDVLLRADSIEAERLVAEAESSWTVDPRSIPLMQRWLARVEGLAAGLDERRAELTALRAEAIADGRGEIVLVEGDRRLVDEALAAEKRADSWEDYLRKQQATPLPIDASPLEKARAAAALALLPVEIPYWREHAADLRRRSGERDTLRSRDPREQERHDSLERLVLAVDHLGARVIEGVRARIDLCDRAGRTREAPTWGRTIAEIADPVLGAAYRGQVLLEPQIGLVPLRRDPRSGLHEFWHVATGVRPELSPDGEWRIEADTGVVLVLIPGGAATAGAQSTDPQAPRYDPDARRTEALRGATLEPFFASKYELTQGQLRRITGRMLAEFVAGMSPIDDPPVTPAHPANKVTWWEARAALERVGLDLPTEVQWEHAARGGSNARYLASDDASVGRTSRNGYDDRWARLINEAAPGFDDGFALPARVGSFTPNAFGLYDVLGNVAEWCRDAYADSCETAAPRPGDGEVEPVERFERSHRGGSYRTAAVGLRVSRRQRLAPDERSEDLGIRPIRRIDRATNQDPFQ